MRLARWIAALAAACALAGCGGGGGSTTAVTPVAAAPTPTATATPTIANTAPITLDAGPAALNVGPNAYTAFNEPYVTITVCAPGSTTNCQTIDHVILDTGSIGVRIVQPVLNAALLAALPVETDTASNGVGECYQYVNSYAFGSVRQLDFQIAGEKVANMPVQVIGDTGTYATVPAGCSAGGGSAITTVQAFGANAIIGVGTTTTDCGSYCASGGQSAAIYYDCPASGCAGVIARAANAAAPFQQLPNPVAAFATDNNGVIVSLPSVPQAGSSTAVTGLVTFGIGTQSNNALAAANVLPLTTSTSRLGAGVLTATYKAKQLTQSFFDTGSNDYFFIDTTLAPCTDKGLIAFYCPSVPMLLSPLLTATNGVTASGAFTLYSPLTVRGDAIAAPGLGINPTLVTPPLPFANSFDFGLPFFFGKTIYTSIEGRTAGSTTGPYVAF